jgi:hypothetical protein
MWGPSRYPSNQCIRFSPSQPGRDSGRFPFRLSLPSRTSSVQVSSAVPCTVQRPGFRTQTTGSCLCNSVTWRCERDDMFILHRRIHLELYRNRKYHITGNTNLCSRTGRVYPLLLQMLASIPLDHVSRYQGKGLNIKGSLLVHGFTRNTLYMTLFVL